MREGGNERGRGGREGGRQRGREAERERVSEGREERCIHLQRKGLS